MLKNLLILGIGACGGYFVGRYITRENIEGKFLLKLDEEAAKYKKHYADLYLEKIAELEHGTPVILEEDPKLKGAVEALSRYQGTATPLFNDPRPLPQVEASGVEFIDSTPMPQAEEADFEFVDPTPTMVSPSDGPYVISEEDYMENKPGYTQEAVTYFAGDEVVVDVHDLRVADSLVDKCIGRHNLERFGTMSNDEDTVYVRYDPYSIDYEITRDQRNYAVVVGGLSEDDG